MKVLVAALVALVSLGAQANYVKKCGADYGKFIKGQHRVVTATTLVSSLFAFSEMEKKQKKAFFQYPKQLRQKTPLEFQSSVYLNTENKVVGHRVRIMKPGLEMTKFYYYFNTAGKLLRSFEKKTQSGRWICEGYKSLNDEIILDLANELGEYVSADDMPSNVLAVTTKKLPIEAQKKLKKLVALRAEDVCPREARANECVNGAMDSEEHFAIYNEGKIIGFIFNIYDDIDHPLWDGSGIYHYLRASDLKVLSTSSWEG